MLIFGRTGKILNYVHVVNCDILHNVSNLHRESYHHGQLRPTLIAHARELLDKGGPSAVSLREAARRSGVSATATYRHFRDKDSLLAAVATEGFREFGATLSGYLGDGLPFAAMGRAYVEFAVAHPGLFRLMFGEMAQQRSAHAELNAAAERAFEMLREAAERSGKPAQGEDDPAVIAAWALVHGLSNLLLDGVLPVEQTRARIETILRSLSFKE